MFSIFVLILLYFFSVFFILRLIVPFYGFFKARLPHKIPSYFEEKIRILNNESDSDKEFVYNCYSFITSKYYGNKVKTFIDFSYAFQDIFSHKDGYLPCTVQNELLRIMLIRSGRFQEKDIRIAVTFFDFFIHQYLLVKVQSDWIPVDPWSHFLGRKFGEKPELFG